MENIFVVETMRGERAAYKNKSAAVKRAIEEYFEDLYPHLEDMKDSYNDGEIITVADQVKADMLSLINSNYIEGFCDIWEIPLY